MANKRVLIVDDDESLSRVLEYNITEEGYTVMLASNGREGLQLFREKGADLVITDLQMPVMDGLEMIRELMAISPDCLVIVLTAFGTVDTAVESMKLGAFDYITKPFNREELKVVVKKALEVGDLKNENLYLKEMVREKYSFENMIGRSQKMVETIKVASQVAKSDVTILITGENGTGKGILAKGIHLNSTRKDKPFVIVNCGAISENLIESELFGHKKGSFTGAISDKKGKFEIADGGTIFLDEIGELKPSHQVKLLRVLQERTIDKVGDTSQIKVDTRILAATNRDIEKDVEDGVFREDLYYRLCVVLIQVPPLRERKDDIPLLIDCFKKKFSNKNSSEPLSMDKKVIRLLVDYKWPGNVRELENLIEGITVMNDGGVITENDLPDKIKRGMGDRGKLIFNLPEEGIDMKEIEKELIIQALEKCEYNQSQTARFLGITRNTLLYRMSKFGID